MLHSARLRSDGVASAHSPRLGHSLGPPPRPRGSPPQRAPLQGSFASPSSGGSSVNSSPHLVDSLGGGGGICGGCAGELRGNPQSDEDVDDAARQGDDIGGDQPERILRQMRKCVLVHHQLSCLLIHRAAMEAGIYGGDNAVAGGGGAGAGASFATSDEQTDASSASDAAAVKQSISRLGGSTTRLFSVALRDRHDLESMGDTLQQRVADMVKSTRGELALAGYGAECQLAALAALEQERSELSFNLLAAEGDEPLTARSAVPSWGGTDGHGLVQEGDGTDAEVEQLAEECRQLAADLAAQQVETARLRSELEETKATCAQEDSAVATACFDEVRRATERNRELQEILDRLRAEAAAAEDTDAAAAEDARRDAGEIILQEEEAVGVGQSTVDFSALCMRPFTDPDGRSMHEAAPHSLGELHAHDGNRTDGAPPPSPTFGRGPDAGDSQTWYDSASSPHAACVDQDVAQSYQRAVSHYEVDSPCMAHDQTVFGTPSDNGHLGSSGDVVVGGMVEELFGNTPKAPSRPDSRPVSFGTTQSNAETAIFSSAESIARLDAQLRQSQSEFYEI